MKNREIKFRAFEDGIMYNDLSYITMRGSAMSANLHTPLIRPVLMQYTGLKDKNGVEVFEGDIVNCITYKEPLSNKTSKCIIGVIKYNSVNACFQIDCHIPDGFRTYPSLNNCEIIGNIHQHPHLLTETK